MSNSGPGYQRSPSHRVAIKPAGVRVQVKLGGEVVAETSEAVAMEETPAGRVLAPLVYYVPRRDVRMERLVRTEHHTYCPFKGEASYFSFIDGPENSVWSYEKPYDEVLGIKELLAFYPDKFDVKAL
jgi:uncharacterized protein (DUF427 family)